MEQLKLSCAEKKLLRHLSIGEYDRNKLPEISNEMLGAAGEYLKEQGLIRAIIDYGELEEAMIKPKGIAYLEEYPNLEDPISVDIEELTKQNLILQNKELEYKEKIRKQERVIRYWQLTTAILGFISIMLSILVLFES